MTSGNDFFECMLDPSMQYSCAWFRDTDDLAQAQREKMDLICRKLGLEKGMSLLDIGCGWGGLARHAAEHYGCRVVGITISEEQRRYGAELLVASRSKFVFRITAKFRSSLIELSALGCWNTSGQRTTGST